MIDIPVVILCGGTGTRMREATDLIPKPLVPIGGLPMVLHIMRWYAKFGCKRFVLALGYKQQAFKDYFYHHDLYLNDVQIHYTKDKRDIRYCGEPTGWDIVLADTGERTMKGGRLKRVQKYVEWDPIFMMTYGDGLSDVNIQELLDFHKSHGKLCTVTGIHPDPRFGEIQEEDGVVTSFSEKSKDGCPLVNGGYFVFGAGIFDYLTVDEWCDLEIGPLELVAERREMMVYRHQGYWGCADTLREVDDLNRIWQKGEAPWKA